MGWKEDREKEQREAEEAAEKQSMEDVEKELLEAEESETLKGFKARREAEANRIKNYLDSRYYFVVCFNNRDQMNEALEKIGFPENSLYVEGHDFMRNIGKPLETPDMQRQRLTNPNKDYVSRARGYKEK